MISNFEFLAIDIDTAELFRTIRAPLKTFQKTYKMR